MTLQLLNRRYVLTIQKTIGFFQASTDNQLRVTSHRMTASIQKTIGATPNTGTIVVYNLADNNREALEGKQHLTVTLEAGYEGLLSRVFSGNVKSCRTIAEPPDVKTTIQLGDGERAYRGARVSRSFGAGTHLKTVIGEVAGSMGLRVPKNVDALVDKYATGVALEGTSAGQMTKILKAVGKEWSIQDGELQIVGRDEVRADEAIVIAETPLGDMIGSPSYADPDKGGRPVLTVSCLLRPQIKPGGKIKVVSKKINGVFRAESVNHDLDTHGQPWTTSVEAKEFRTG